MRTPAALLVACLLTLSAGGCAEVQGYIDKTAAVIENPNTQLVLKTVGQGTVVVLCDISAVAQVTDTIETAVDADKSLIGTTGKIYAGSSAACTGIGGLVLGTTPAPAAATVVAKAPTS